MFLLDAFVDIAEDLEYFVVKPSNPYRDEVTVYFEAKIDEWIEGEVRISLIPIQAIEEVGGQSPVGCNACDLADPTLPHKHYNGRCPVLNTDSITLVVRG